MSTLRRYLNTFFVRFQAFSLTGGFLGMADDSTCAKVWSCSCIHVWGREGGRRMKSEIRGWVMERRDIVEVEEG